MNKIIHLKVHIVYSLGHNTAIIYYTIKHVEKVGGRELIKVHCDHE